MLFTINGLLLVSGSRNIRLSFLGKMFLVFFFSCFATSGSSVCFGQAAGLRSESQPAIQPKLNLNQNEIYGHVRVTASSQTLVKPDRIRLVWAVIAESENADQGMKEIKKRFEKARDLWMKIGIPASDVVEDFISVKPKYNWKTSQENGLKVLREETSGFQTQFNLHVSVKDEKDANECIQGALSAGIQDLIAVDYCADLSKVRSENRRKAITATKAKASDLFEMVFERKLTPINVTCNTLVHYPESLYKKIYSPVDRTVFDYRQKTARIYKPKPEYVYYRGLGRDAEVKKDVLPMNPMIIVESTATIYYRHPEKEPFTLSGYGKK